MKIICIGRNYAAHAAELNNEVPDEPVIFLKPDSAVHNSGNPFVIPEWTDDVHYEAELILKIGRQGKYIDEQFAWKYISHVSVGIDFTARDIQSKLKSKGLPWEKAKAFDGSAVIGEWQALDPEKKQFSFSLDKNGQKVQHGDTDLMINSIPSIISHVSQYFTLKTGDIIFTGTPEGVGKVAAGDVLAGFYEEKEVFRIKVK